MKSGLTALLLLFSLNVAFAQKAKVQAAYNYLKYDQLDKAKEAIDEALLDDASKAMDKTWYYRGIIYESIYNSDKYREIAPDALDISALSYRKALEIAPESEYKGEITTRLSYVRTDYFNKGVLDYRSKNYTAALADFENVLKIVANDTNAVLYAAYAAEKSKNNAKAIQYYQKVIEMNNDEPATYRSLAELYKEEKDQDRSLYMLEQGRKKYPDDLDLILAQINVFLPMGKNKEAIELLNLAVAKDTANASLYFAMGATYDNLANPRDAQGNALAKPEDQKALLMKAADAYKMALKYKPDYFEANYNLGALYFNQAAEQAQNINNVKDAKEYQAAKQRLDGAFALAQPYLEKALELSPNDRDTLISLKQLYASQNSMEKYYKVKDRLDALGK